MRATLLASTLLLAAHGTAHAAEGMWLPSQAPALAEQLQQAGLEIPAEALANMNAAPMNAIASLGGCSAAFLSPKGLVATNHHCVYNSLQYNSAEGRDLLTDGFLAKSMAEELPAAPNVRVLVMQELTDVTPAMLAGITAKTPDADRMRRLDTNRKQLTAACESEPGIRCDIRPYFGGGTWVRQKMLEIRDVRLVHAPAGSVGNFGGEIDNWMWPRQTGDYSFYRAYVGPDGKPAAYAAANIPYAPRAHLKAAQSELKPGDFVLIAGFPGRTERYRTATETRAYYSDIYPLQQRLLTEHSALIEREAKTQAEKIAYANLKRRSDNYKKKIGGQMEAARKANLIAAKEAEDKALAQWASQPANRRPHAAAIANHDEVIDDDLAATRTRLINAELNRAQLLKAARDLFHWANEQAKPDAERAIGWQDRDRQRLIDRLSLIDRQYVPRIDRLLLEKALADVAQLPEADRNMALEAAIADIGLQPAYANTRLADRETRMAWLDRPVADFAASDDPFIQIAVRSWAADAMAEERRLAREGALHRARSAWMDTVKAYQATQGRLPYPDANGSLRFTFGHVKGRPIEDGKAWEPFTTTRGLLEKESGTEPFNSPPKLLDLARAQDFGRWASPALGAMPVNFLSTTDITNGNSGSSVLNARGEFVGLAFDGTLEGMLSDWAFDDNVTRTISLDSRYMFWVMDKVDGASYLLTEMGLN